MIFNSELDSWWSKDVVTAVPGPKAKGALFRKAMCTLVLKLLEFAIVCVCGNLKKKLSVILALWLDSRIGGGQPQIVLLRWV